MSTKQTTIIWHILLIAFIYAATGRIGQLLGPVTLVWPPSGIALIFLLYRGNYSLIGIWLGAFIANTWVFWDTSSVQMILKTVAVGSMIGVGSFLQPLFGRRVLHRQEHPRNLLSSYKLIYRFLSVVPVMCLISSIIGTSSLCLCGFAQWTNFWSIWHTWWIGDSLGVLLIVPVVTYWVSDLSHISFKNKLMLASPIILTVSIGLLVFFLIKHNEMVSIQSQFKTKTEKKVGHIEYTLKEDLKHINTLGGLISVIGNSITLDQFSTYCKLIAKQTRSIKAMEWIPIIQNDQRNSFEEMATKQWGQIFKIKEMHNNKLVPAKTREKYTPVYLVEPLKGNERALGYDLSSNPKRLQTLEYAIRLNQNTLSPPIGLVQGAANSYGFLYFVPVAFPQDTVDGNQTFSGFALGLFTVESLVSDLLKTFNEQKISSRITVMDRLTQQETVIFEQTSATEQPSLFGHRETIDIGGRDWTFHFRAGEAFIPPGSFMLSKIALVIGHVFCLLLTLLLIIIRGRIEADRKYRKTAETANRAKTEFLANMSHEIRTPMHAILGFTEILRNKEQDSKNLRFFQSIHNSGNALLNLINDILDLSKVEAGKLELQYSPVSIKNLCNEMKTIFDQRIKDKGLELNIEVRECCFKALLLDQHRLRQILVNLIGNSIKFTDKGHIQLTTYTHPSKSGSSCVELIIEVADTGIGIAKDQQHNLFNAFEQVKGQKSYKYGGSGLGLTITRNLIEMMKGKISIDSEPGKGSTFRIVLKDVEIAALQPAEHLETRTINFDKIQFESASILIADDIDYNREMLATYLEEWKFKIIYAENGREAIEQANRHCPDVITLDMRMPEMDGYKAIELLQKDDKLKSIPVIAITASALKQDEDVLMKLCSGYLPKPVSRTDLVRELMKHVPYTLKFEETKGEELSRKITPKEIILPPQDEIKRLIHAAETGSVTELKECIANIKAMEEKYQSFVDKIEAWMHIYEFDRIVEFLESYPEKT